MRIEGPTRDLDPKIDFSEWSWGDFDGSMFKPVADRVAEVLWAEITDSIAKSYHRPLLDTDSDGGGPICIAVGLLDTHHLIIPLGEIEIDEELIVAKSRDGPWQADFEATLAQQQQAVDILRGWIANIEAQMVETAKQAQRGAKP